MPRRHNRDRLEPEPLAITESKPRRRERTARRMMTREAEFIYLEKQRAAARRKRVQDAINWDVCMVPGCKADVRVPEYQRDVDVRLPICAFHATVVNTSNQLGWFVQEEAEQAHRGHGCPRYR